MGLRLRVGSALALVALAASLAVWASRPSPTAAATRRTACGVERWTVKTLGDRPALLSARSTTVAFLTSRPAPDWLPQTRLPFERRVYRVRAAVTLVREESDGDFHLVLQDTAGRTMIAESPLASCGKGATLERRRQMETARLKVRVCARASVTGSPSSTSGTARRVSPR